MLDGCGGVDPDVGVFDAGGSRWEVEPELTGSAECCRFSYVAIESAHMTRDKPTLTLTHLNLPNTF